MDSSKKFTLKPIRYSIGIDNHCFIEERSESKWAFIAYNMCMNKDGEFYYEPSPSNRDEDFIREHRFDSPEEALNCFIEKGTVIINGRDIKTGQMYIGDKKVDMNNIDESVKQLKEELKKSHKGENEKI